MPLPRWLHSLLARKPSQTDGPPPRSGEGWGGGLRPTIPTSPTPDPSPPGGGEDHSHRIHIAANDPAFPAKREAAVALICAAIEAVATPMGYTRKGTTWSRTSPSGRTAINLQRSSYGFTAFINLRFLLPDGTSANSGVWAMDDTIRLLRFYLPHEPSGTEDGDLTYLDVHENPASLDQPMLILAILALPWLDAHHSVTDPEIEDYLPRQA